MASSASGPSLLRSPRSNIEAALSATLPPGEPLPPALFDLAYGSLLPADAENKLHHRKLYLVLDLDETLVYAHRLAPDETPVGTLIHVRGTPYDVVPRPGLKFFLNMALKNFIIYLYTMGDSDYAHAVLKVIDPESKYFRGAGITAKKIETTPIFRPCVVCTCACGHTCCGSVFYYFACLVLWLGVYARSLVAGGACCWRPTESRQHKSLARVVCDKRMALIVDDSVDVWGGDLGNLCLTRRFVGDKSDDGLQLLGGQLMQVHSQFFKGAPSEGYSLEAPSGSPRCPPNVFSVLSGSRGDVFRGCRIALTGIVSDLSEETLAVEGVPLAGLIQLYGGELCLSVDQATHLVARRKEGWKSSPKVKKALNRIKVGALSRTLPSDRCGAHPCHPRQHFFCTRCAKSQRARARQKHQRPSRGSSIFRRKAFTWSEARGKAGCRSFSCLLTMNKRLKEGCRAEGAMLRDSVTVRQCKQTPEMLCLGATQ